MEDTFVLQIVNAAVCNLSTVCVHMHARASNDETCILFYTFSRLCIQAGLIIANNEVVVNISNTGSFNNISDGSWHSAVLIKIGSHIQLFIDDQLAAETNSTLQFITTDSDLFIGGIPSGSHDIIIKIVSYCIVQQISCHYPLYSGNASVSLPGVINEGFKGEMRMAYLAHAVRNHGVQTTNT